MWLLIILWILILVFNAIYSFLPIESQNTPWIRFCAIGAATVILVYGIYQLIRGHQNRSFAYVASDGKILRSKNFPWQITKDYKEGKTIYMINERYGDASQLSINLDKPNSENQKYEIYNAMDGLGIKFSCHENEISNFLVKIKN